MKKQKQSLLIHVWEQYEFYLYVPQEVNRDSKPFIFYYYQDLHVNKPVRIKKFIGQNKGDKRVIQNEAKKEVLKLIILLQGNYNPLTKQYNELTISPLSTIQDCMNHWILANEVSFKNESISWKRLKNVKIVAMHFREYLTRKSLLHLRANAISNIHIKDFLDSKSFDRNWGKVTYNTYRTDIGTLFNYLIDLNILSLNPVTKTPKKVTKFDSSRFRVYEQNELIEVANLLVNDSAYLGLYVASKFLFKYNIRPLEIIRIQIKDIDWTKNILTLTTTKTKNGNEAKFLLDEDISVLLRKLIKDDQPDQYVFGRRNMQSSNRTCADYLGQRWRAFRKKYNISPKLKFYALKHTSNYYDIENGASYEEIRQRNRHSNLQITTLYIKERLFKNIIKPSSSTKY